MINRTLPVILMYIQAKPTPFTDTCSMKPKVEFRH